MRPLFVNRAKVGVICVCLFSSLFLVYLLHAKLFLLKFKRFVIIFLEIL